MLRYFVHCDLFSVENVWWIRLDRKSNLMHEMWNIFYVSTFMWRPNSCEKINTKTMQKIYQSRTKIYQNLANFKKITMHGWWILNASNVNGRCFFYPLWQQRQQMFAIVQQSNWNNISLPYPQSEYTNRRLNSMHKNINATANILC